MNREKKSLSFFVRLLPVLMSLLLVIVVYYPVFFKGYYAVNGSDAFNLHIPNNYFAAQEFKQGRIPVWNPNFNLGQPISDGTNPIFHPAIILYLVFNPWMANTIEILLGLFLILLGMWYFLRQMQFGIFSAFIGIIAYVFSGPVFFQHSYHLGFMAILLLPWCLLIFHKYDLTGQIRWLWIAAVLCIFAGHSLDADLLLYLFLGFIIDRIVCIPRYHRRGYLITWLAVLSLSALTWSVRFFPFYEWLRYSSRLNHSYIGILTPNISNLIFAIITGHWLTNWPYEVFYFYFGPAVIWLAISGVIRLNKTTYLFRYFLWSLIIPIFYTLIRFLQWRYSDILSSLDPWRSMFIFCFALSMLAAVGTQHIIKGRFIQKRLTLFGALVTILLSYWSNRYNMGVRIYSMLLIAGFGMLFTIFPWSKKHLIFPKIGILMAIIGTLLTASIHYAIGTRFCIRSTKEINGSLALCYNLAKTSDSEEAHWRVAMFGGVNNITSLAGLKSMPNYTTFYNKEMEERFISDDLIARTTTQPYWMILKTNAAYALSYYGVRFLITDPYAIRSDWNKERLEWNDDGWVERPALGLDDSWPEYAKYRVWENKYYIGRAYIVTPTGHRHSGIEFLQDTPASVSLRVEAKDGDRIVLSDLYYPGWQAFVDEKPVPTEVYHGCLRSVSLSKGIHIVRWEYNAKIQKLGLISSIIALLILVSFLGFLTVLKTVNDLQNGIKIK